MVDVGDKPATERRAARAGGGPGLARDGGQGP